MNNQQKKEQVIQEAFNLLEQGKSESSIIETYPQFNVDLVNVFKTVHIIQDQKNTVFPPEALLQSILNKLPHEALLKSPYQDLNSSFFWRHLSNFQKISISSIVVITLLVGGVFYNYHSLWSGNNSKNNNIISSNDASNTAFEQDMKVIYTEMNGLNADNANTDQALNAQSS